MFSLNSIISSKKSLSGNLILNPHGGYVKVGISPSKKMCIICFNESPTKMIKNNEKCFLFHLKRFFCSQNVQIFVLTFWSCRKKTAWQHVKKHKVHFKIYNVTTRLKNNYDKHIGQYLTNKSNQKMKLGQFAEYNKINTFLQKSCRKWGQKTSSRPFFTF